jgi:hypothetical protein
MGHDPLDDLYQEIAREAMATAGDDRAGKLLVYAEVERGGAEADVAYVNRRGDVTVVLGPGSLVDAVYSLWRRWKEQHGKEQWRAMSYLVDEEGELTMNPIYPDDFDENEDDRRARAVEKYFGKGKRVIYARLSA